MFNKKQLEILSNLVDTEIEDMEPLTTEDQNLYNYTLKELYALQKLLNS